MSEIAKKFFKLSDILFTFLGWIPRQRQGWTRQWSNQRLRLPPSPPSCDIQRQAPRLQKSDLDRWGKIVTWDHTQQDEWSKALDDDPLCSIIRDATFTSDGEVWRGISLLEQLTPDKADCGGDYKKFNLFVLPRIWDKKKKGHQHSRYEWMKKKHTLPLFRSSMVAALNICQKPAPDLYSVPELVNLSIAIRDDFLNVTGVPADHDKTINSIVIVFDDVEKEEVNGIRRWWTIDTDEDGKIQRKKDSLFRIIGPRKLINLQNLTTFRE